MVDLNRIAAIARRYYDTRDEKALFAEGGVLSGGEKVLLVACLIRVPGRGDGFNHPGGMADIFAKKNKINMGRLTILDDSTGRQFAQVMGWLPPPSTVSLAPRPYDPGEPVEGRDFQRMPA